MNGVTETIKYSMGQTDKCMEMAEQVIEWNKQLLGHIRLLEIENEELKNRLNKGGTQK